MLNVVDELMRECLSIRINRKLKSSGVIDLLAVPISAFVRYRLYSFSWPGSEKARQISSSSPLPPSLASASSFSMQGEAQDGSGPVDGFARCF
jgi:hypothetical protein